jgi:hypothetical protein
VEMRVYFQRPTQVVLRIRIIGQAVVDHAGMKQEQRIITESRII